MNVSGWVVLAGVGVLVLLVLALAVALTRSRKRTDAALEAARADATALRAQVEAIEQQLRRTASSRPRTTGGDETEYTITMLGQDTLEPEGPSPSEAPVPVVSGPLFADLVLRESVVQAGSLAAGLRRALAPEVRHRIRFEMKREVKRARKQRRLDLREARRDWESRQRRDLAGESPA